MTHQYVCAIIRNLCVIFTVSLFACNNATQPLSVVTPGGNQYSEIIELARAEVQKARSLSFIRTVKTGVITREQYRKTYSGVSSSGNDLVMNAFKQYGFVPDTVSGSKYIVNNTDSFAAAFYKPGSDSLYIIDASKYNEGMLFIIAAHEFTHALQEQHFNPFTNQIYSGLLQSNLNSDYYLSQLCIAEGDATVNELYTYYNYTIQPDAVRDSVASYITSTRADYYDSIKTKNVPSYLNIQGYAPYQIGAGFVWDIFTKGTWNAVNRLYHADRPVSTKQIITGSAQAPWSFDFSAIMPVLLSNTTKLVFADDDTYGPVMLMALLSNYVDTEHCKEALGWQGDRCAFTLSDNQKWGSFVWALKFDTPDNADYVYERLDSLYTKRDLGQLTATRIADTSGITYTNANSQLFLRKNGTFIFIMDNVSNKSTVLASLDNPSVLAKKQSQTAMLPQMADVRVKHQIIDMIIGR